MLYCNKHSESCHSDGFAKIMSHAIISKLKLFKFNDSRVVLKSSAI